MGFRYCFSFLICAVFIQNSNARLTPDFIHPCKQDDIVCLMQSTKDAIPEFAKGIPELGVPPLDPFVIEKLTIALPGLKFSFYNAKVTGFKKCIVDNIESDVRKHRFDMEFHCNVTLKGGYDAVGRILLFPINGQGDAKVKITNLKMRSNLTTKFVDDDKGVRHYALKDYKYSFDYGDKVHMHMTNLFKESKELSDTVLTFLNENWRQVAQEFGKPIMDYAVDLSIRTIEKFFLAVPFEELVDGEPIVRE